MVDKLKPNTICKIVQRTPFFLFLGKSIETDFVPIPGKDPRLIEKKIIIIILVAK